MNPGHLGSCGFSVSTSLSRSVFINLCLSHSLFSSLACALSSSLSSSSLFLSLFSSSVLTVCLPPPALPHLKNYFAHLDRALHGRYTISPLVALIKNRSEYRVRISQDFSSSPASSCLPSSYAELYWLMLEMDMIESEKLAAKCPSPPCFFSAHSLCVCCGRSSECLSVSMCTACGPLRWVLSHVERCV